MFITKWLRKKFLCCYKFKKSSHFLGNSEEIHNFEKVDLQVTELRRKYRKFEKGKS